MIVTKDLCTSLEASKLLAETGLMSDVEADYYHKYDDLHMGIPAFRLDKICQKIHEVYPKLLVEGWASTMFVHLDWGRELEEKIFDMRLSLDFFHGQKSANQAAKLLWLLWKEGLINV